jgi:murein DD-endopeptidase MepM/ murein hydrolase activator NlpD
MSEGTLTDALRTGLGVGTALNDVNDFHPSNGGFPADLILGNRNTQNLNQASQFNSSDYNFNNLSALLELMRSGYKWPVATPAWELQRDRLNEIIRDNCHSEGESNENYKQVVHINNGARLPILQGCTITDIDNVERINPLNKKKYSHRGVDVGAAKGTTIPAIETGYIIGSFKDKSTDQGVSQGSWLYNYGTCIYIYHPQVQDANHIVLRKAVIVLYAHMETLTVNLFNDSLMLQDVSKIQVPERRIEKGQIIGTVGGTGRYAEGRVHLHLTLYKEFPDKTTWDGDAYEPLTFNWNN